MLKIGKGLKKKIKGKKSKGHEDDLFDPEQLAKYKKELEEAKKAAAAEEGDVSDQGEDHNGATAAHTSSEADHEKDEEWLKFKLLTGGVDDIVKKAATDLDRIKETTYYQKPKEPEPIIVVPKKVKKGQGHENQESEPSVAAVTPSAETKPHWQVNFVGDEIVEQNDLEEKEEHVEEEPEPEEPKEPEPDPFKPVEIPEDIVEVDDSLFDTTYLDAFETGDIQLAHIPDSPTEEEGEDPFDTSGVADVIKKIELEEKKKKRQVNLDLTVNLLTGKEKDKANKSGATSPALHLDKAAKAPKARARPVAVSLLGDFDECGGVIAPVVVTKLTSPEKTQDIFDVIDSTVAPPISPSADTVELVPAPVQNTNKDDGDKTPDWRDVIGEFDTIISKSEQLDGSTAGANLIADLEAEDDDEFAQLASESLHKDKKEEPEPEEEEDDPFDTGFVAEVAPDLVQKPEEPKVPDSLLLDDDDFDPRAGETPSVVCEPKNTEFTDHLEIHTDVIKEKPIRPAPPKKEEVEIKPIAEVEDPFDTSVYTAAAPPGKHEIKLLEEELLNSVETPVQPRVVDLSKANRTLPPTSLTVEEDDDFDPRAGEEPTHILDHGPEVEETVCEVLVPSATVTTYEEPDPFDTSIVSSAILPGKLELRILESELVTPAPEPKVETPADTDFNPRLGEEPPVGRLVSPQPLRAEDILESSQEQQAGDKPLTPQAEGAPSKFIPVEDFEDPFDTSNIPIEDTNQPKKQDLKALEGELLNSTEDVKPARPIVLPKPPPPPVEPVAPQPAPQPVRPPPPNVIEDEDPHFHCDTIKPLTPSTEVSEEIDPFDTSGIVVGPGKAELERLEEELGVKAGIPRSYTDEDFNPRGTIHPSAQLQSQPLAPVPVAPCLQPTVAGEIEDDPFDTTSAEAVLPTKVDVKGFNPFLAEAPAPAAPPSGPSAFLPAEATPAPASNPFLDFGAPAAPAGANENPFLNFAAGGAVSAPAPSAVARNPFADFGAPADVSNGPFSSITHDHAPPTDFIGIQDDKMMASNTQHLLESVTGQLEATSESLLQRANQPSPIPPSPSPRTPSPDLMMGDETPTAVPSTAPATQTTDSILDLMDDNQSGSMPKTTMDILGLYHSAPKPAPVAPAIPTAAPVVPTATVATTAVPIASIIDTPATPPVTETRKQSIPAVEPKGEVLSPPESKPGPPPRPPSPAKTPSPIASPHSSRRGSEAVSKPTRPELPLQANTGNKQSPSGSPVKPTPERPPPPPPSKSPVLENKAMPSRPPPPVPPAPRASPQPPVVPPQPAAPPVVPPQPVAAPVLPPQPVAAPVVPPQPAAPPVPPQHAAASVIPPQPTAPPVPKEPFAAPAASPFAAATTNTVFSSPAPTSDPFGAKAAPPAAKTDPFGGSSTNAVPPKEFDAFDQKFESLEAVKPTVDPFGGSSAAFGSSGDAWGSSGTTGASDDFGFGGDDKFDNFLALTEPPPVPQSTPAKTQNEGHEDFDKDDAELSVVIRPRGEGDDYKMGLAPALAPPPKSPALSTASGYSDETTPAFVPFLSAAKPGKGEEKGQARRDSQDSPQTPLFEEDTSQPLEDFPRIHYNGEFFEMQMRHPNKKKMTGQRYWKKVFVKIATAPNDNTAILQLYWNKTDKDPFQEIPLQSCYSVSEIGAQQYDNYGKIFTVKLQYIFYKERPGIRPGQISKAGRTFDKLSQFAAYAIVGDYSGVKEFGGDLKKLGLPVEHAPQISQLVKLGTQDFEDLKKFSMAIEECLFRLPAHRDRALTYKTEEIQVTLVDEYYVEEDIYGVITRQIARVRVFFLSFLSGVADIEMGLNDMRRQGKEVVGRHDIIPIPTEEWIRMENVECNSCVDMEEFNKTQTAKFRPPDASYLELMRFRVRPPKHRELPLQVKTVFTTLSPLRIEIKCDILVPGFTSRKLGQIPCEDVMIRIPIPEGWIYMFRVEKHFRYGSVKSAHRRSGKVKGIERFLGAVEAVEQSLMEVTSGQAKYEHQHRAIVWRIPRLPKEGQGAYTTHNFVCHINLQPHEKIPDNLATKCYVEFTMPHTTVSHTVVRSISVPTSEEPPEKYVRYLSRHEYIIDIEHTQGFTPATYNVAAAVEKKEEPIKEEPMVGKAESDSDFSDDYNY